MASLSKSQLLRSSSYALKSVLLRIVFAPVRLLAFAWSYAMAAVPYSIRRRYINDERHFKAVMLRRVARAYGYRHFVETGTHRGDTPHDLRYTFESIVTIEIDPVLHAAAQKRFADQPHIRCVLGDSKEELARIGPSLDQPTVFWLDGHYSGTGTGGAGSAAPLAAELGAIRQSPRNDHIIVIDDMSDFSGELGNEKLSSVIAGLEAINPQYKFYFDFDMLFALPHEQAHRDFWRKIAMPTHVR
jgi:hypothetical protein